MKSTVALLGSALILLAAACSGATTDPELFGPGAPHEPGPVAPGDGPGPADPSTPGSSGGGQPPSELPDAGEPDGSSSGGPTDAGHDAGPPPPTIACGTTTCEVGSQVCCSGFQGRTCEADGNNACGRSLRIACDDRTDCPAGQVCCGSLGTTGYTSVTCKNSCTGNNEARFCDEDAAVDECADIGRTCAPSSRLAGYSVCQR